jgi:Fic family protein
VTPPADPFAAVAAIPGVADRVTTARAVVDQALGHTVLRRRSAEVTVHAGLRSARATAALEGADFQLEDVRSFVLSGDPDPDAATLAGALRLSGELGSVLVSFERAPLQAFARLHLLAAADVVKADGLGRPRTPDEDSEDLLGLPPARPSAEVTARLGLLADLLAGPTTAPALVVSAIVHGELLALRPFVWGNGLVARAAGRLVLVARGLDPKAVTAPEVGHAADASAYREAALAYIDGDVGAWIAHCAEATELGARETLAICAAIERAG